MLCLTKEEMKTLDRCAIEEFHIPSLILMEYAARSAYEFIARRFPITSRIMIVSGSGNNGADGLCLARQLKHGGYQPLVFLLAGPDKLSEEGKLHYASLLSLGMEVFRADALSEEELRALFQERAEACDLIVDAIFGISLNRPVGGIYRSIIEGMNRSGARLLSLDLPSGIDADSGKELGISVKADYTVSFAHPKRGLYLNEGARRRGELQIADIGIPKEAETRLASPLKVLDETCFAELPPRDPEGHKGSFGKVLIIAGSYNMAGAAALSAKACYRAGAGLVYVLSHRENRVPILAQVPEAIVHSYDEQSGEADLKAQVRELAENADCVLIGCGLSKGVQAEALLHTCIELEKPLLLDADALNLLAERRALFQTLKTRTQSTVLTPHLGEMARLCSLEIGKIKEDPIGIAREFTEANGCILCLKSANTVVCFESGGTYLNLGGNSGMATAGSGDVLAGILSAKLAISNAQDLEARLLSAIFLHSRAGELAKESGGEERLIASDLIEHL
ncbi:MAG: NAD(P)H-hydrate dehydratase [Bacillota bacterium]|nr:NAD(P)H-hydrate dehydratase [Bacillota bacterium]